MRISRAFAAAAAVVAGVLCTAVADVAPTPPSGPPLKVKVLTRQIDVHPDGSSTTVTHSEVQILAAALLTQLAQQPVTYDASTQQLEIAEAYTLKADGRKLAVAPDAILSRQSPASASSLLFTDYRQKVIVFPNVEVGDTLVYTARTESKPQFPGQFTFDIVMPSTLLIDRTSVSVTAPAALALNVDAKGLDISRSAGGGGATVAVSYANDKPVSDSGEALSRFDRGPRFSVSTFRSYDELAAAYAALVQPRLAVTPAIEAEAATITAGVADKREQAHRIYDWVSSHIRYVAIELGTGNIVPHDAGSVLANAYGDCKDHAVLFQALLKAKGIAADLVLIDSENTYSVAGAPTLGAFDHMIVWLPQFKLYADTTAGIAAFGTLPQTEYGKPVVHVGDTGPALRQTPVLGPKEASVHHVTAVVLDDTARLAVSTTTTATGTLAMTLRRAGQVIQTEGTVKFAADILKQNGMPLATGDYTIPPLSEISGDYSIRGTYNTQHRPKMLSGEAFVVPAGLYLISSTGEFFLGPLADDKFKDAAAMPCYSGRDIEDYSLEFPASKRLDKLPEDAVFHSAHIDYSSHWSLSGHTLVVHRELTAAFDKPVCSGDIRKEVSETLARVRENYATRIALLAAP